MNKSHFIQSYLWNVKKKKKNILEAVYFSESSYIITLFDFHNKFMNVPASPFVAMPRSMWDLSSLTGV